MRNNATDRSAWSKKSSSVWKPQPTRHLRVPPVSDLPEPSSRPSVQPVRQSNPRALRSPKCSRDGFSLLEVVLSLGLAAFLFAALWASTDVYLRSVEAGRAETENAQLARALLRQIADDLRSTVVFSPADLSAIEDFTSGAGLESILPSELLEGGDGEIPEGSEVEEGPPDDGNQGEIEPPEGYDPNDPQAELDPLAAGLDALQAGELADSLTPAELPGLVGTSFQMQIDISRLPRLDQYQAVTASPDAAIRDTASDVKTVAYFVIPASHSAGSTGRASSGRAPGLYRREIDRAVTLWASEQGQGNALAETAEPLAPEVTGLQFRYFNGEQWFTQWDSTSQGGPPVAVEVAMAIRNTRPVRSTTWSPSALLGSAPPPRPDRVYRLLVHLPSGAGLYNQEVLETLQENPDTFQEGDL